MNTGAKTVKQWLELNADKLIPCRWGGRITTDACRSYQTRRSRFTVYFRTFETGYVRPNADFLKCVSPEPCPYLIPGAELDDNPEWVPLEELEAAIDRRREVAEVIQMARYTDPEEMLSEEDWMRSLISDDISSFGR